MKVHGRKVWQARVAFQGLRSSRVCESRDAAKLAQAELLQELKRKAGQADQVGLAPATLRQLFFLPETVVYVEQDGRGDV